MKARRFEGHREKVGDAAEGFAESGADPVNSRTTRHCWPVVVLPACDRPAARRRRWIPSAREDSSRRDAQRAQNRIWLGRRGIIHRRPAPRPCLRRPMAERDLGCRPRPAGPVATLDVTTQLINGAVDPREGRRGSNSVGLGRCCSTRRLSWPNQAAVVLSHGRTRRQPFAAQPTARQPQASGDMSLRRASLADLEFDQNLIWKIHGAGDDGQTRWVDVRKPAVHLQALTETRRQGSLRRLRCACSFPIPAPMAGSWRPFWSSGWLAGLFSTTPRPVPSSVPVGSPASSHRRTGWTTLCRVRDACEPTDRDIVIGSRLGCLTATGWRRCRQSVQGCRHIGAATGSSFCALHRMPVAAPGQVELLRLVPAQLLQLVRQLPNCPRYRNARRHGSCRSSGGNGRPVTTPSASPKTSAMWTPPSEHLIAGVPR